MRGARVACAAVALAALALAAVAFAAPPPVATARSPIPFVVCDQYGGQAGPDIAGTVAVWTDDRNGNLDIYGEDLGTGRIYAVCTDKAQQDNPAVTRDVTASSEVHYVAVWVDHRNRSGGATGIYGRDITARRNFVVARSASVKWFPDISGRWVVWIEAHDAAGPYRIEARDLVAGQTYQVATSKVLSPVAVDWRRLASGQVVTSAVYASGSGDISGRDLPDGEPFVVSAKDTFEWMPDISHNRVVWWESGGRIMLRDLLTGTRTFVHRGSRPRISGGSVTWDGGGHGGEFVISYVAGARISVRDMAGDAGVVSFGAAGQTNLFPAISGRRVVWETGPARRVLLHIHIDGARLR